MNIEYNVDIDRTVRSQGNNYKYLLGNFSFSYNDKTVFKLLNQDEKSELLDLLNEVDDGAELVGVFPTFLVFELIYSVFEDFDKITELINKLVECIEDYLTKYELI